MPRMFYLLALLKMIERKYALLRRLGLQPAGPSERTARTHQSGGPAQNSSIPTTHWHSDVEMRPSATKACQCFSLSQSVRHT